MGLIASTLSALAPRRGLSQKVAAGAAIQTWQAGTPQYPQYSYERFARDGYGRNELVYACIEELASSASEPRLAAYRDIQPDPERVPSHSSLDLLNHPNQWMSRYAFMAAIVLYRSLAGNVFIEKVRSQAGKVVELWLLRPDRIRIIPDLQKHIRGYLYEIGAQKFTIDAADIIHIKTNNPLDDFYGMPPLLAAAQRVDVDNFMRQFVASFFSNAGVPAGLLNIKKTLEADDRMVLDAQYRSQFGGSSGWHGLMVLDGTEAEFTPLGMPVGERGLAMPSLDEISEARIPMVFGVPLELIGARLGMVHGNRSTTKEARASFWDETLTPLYTEISEAITLGLRDDFPDVDYWEFDYSKVKALAEDEDAKHKRIREDLAAGLITLEEAREALGHEPNPKKGDTFMLASTVVPWPVDSEDPLGSAPALDPNQVDPNGQQPSPDFPGQNPANPPDMVGAGAQRNGTAR